MLRRVNLTYHQKPMPDIYRRLRRLVLDPPGGRLIMAAPRTFRFLLNSAARGLRAPVYPDPPAPRPTPGLALQVAMDEVILAAMKSPGFQTLLIRGVEWAATGAVRTPVPAELTKGAPGK